MNRKEYEANPKVCKKCETVIPFEKRRNDFCDRSCSTAYNNKGTRRHGKKPSLCEFCGKPTSSYKGVYCSRRCQQDHNWEKIKQSIIEGTYDCMATRQLRRFLIETRGYKCESCGLTEWMGKKIPLVCDHIDGNAFNNKADNLRLICNNCDSISEHYKWKNKGRGRLKRRLRRKKQKEKMGFSYA